MNLASFELTSVDIVQEMLTRPLGGVDGWDLQVTQLQRGAFSGRYASSALAGEQSRIVVPDKSELGFLQAKFRVQISGPSIYAAHHKYGRLLHLAGHTPTDFVGFIIPLQEKPQIRYKGRILKHGQIIALTKPRQEVDFVSQADTEFLSIRISSERADMLLFNAGFTHHEPLTGITRPDPRLLQLFKREVYRLLYREPKLDDFQDLIAHRSLEAELFEHMSFMLDGSRPAALNLNQERCCAIAHQVRDYLEANLDRIVNVSELCSFFELRPRTLHYAFKACFGVPPSRYHRYRRLQQVRVQLLHRNPAETTVTEVAAESHFFHFGRFAAEYKSVFGETPKQTLAIRA